MVFLQILIASIETLEVVAVLSSDIPICWNIKENNYIEQCDE